MAWGVFLRLLRQKSWTTSCVRFTRAMWCWKSRWDWNWAKLFTTLFGHTCTWPTWRIGMALLTSLYIPSYTPSTRYHICSGGKLNLLTLWWTQLVTVAVWMKTLLVERHALAEQFHHGSLPSERWSVILSTFSQRGRGLAMDKRGSEKCGTMEAGVGCLYHAYTMHIPCKYHANTIQIPFKYHANTIYRMQEPKVYSNIGQYAGYISICSMDVKYRRPQDVDVNLFDGCDL